MKSVRKIFAVVLAGLLIASTSLNFGGCSKDIAPNAPQIVSESSSHNQSLAKRPVKEERMTNTFMMMTTPYPMTSSVVAYYQKKQKAYLGGYVALPNGSTFWLDNKSLTPPSELDGKNVTITFTMDKVADSEYITSFGPHGSTFDPPAKLYLHWEELGIPVDETPELYYIEDDGSYTAQQPDEIDLQNKFLIIYVHHFSRYAMAWSE